MYSPLHASAGVLLAAAVPNPMLGLPLAIVSHYLLDAIPHGDMRKPPHFLALSEGRRLALTELFDLPLAGIVVWKLTTVFATINPLYLVLGAVAGILPDVLWGGKFLLEKIGWRWPGITRLLEVHHRWHEWVHVKEARDIPFWVGVGYHLLVIVVVLFSR